MSATFGVLKFRRLVFVGSFSVLVDFLMGFFGSILAGHLLGEDALSGVSLLAPVFSTLIFVSSLFGVGMGVNYALAMGRCEKRRAYEIFSQGLLSVIVVGASLAFLFWLGYGAFVRFMGPSDVVAGYACDYARWFVAVPFLQVLAGYFRNCCYADGDDRQCYVVYIVQLVANLGISFAAIRSGWGVAGCALGATCGFALSSVILALHFLKPSNSFRLVRHVSLADAWQVVRTSFGDASSNLFAAGLFFFLGKYFIARFGSAELPVLSVVIATLGLLDFFGGVGQAAQPIVSVYVGERNTLGARRVMNAAILIAVSEGVVVTALLLAFPDAAIAMVGLETPALVGSARLAVRLITVGFVFMAFTNLLNGYYILIGHELISTGFSFLVGMLAPVVLVVALGAFGKAGVWCALGIAPALGVGLFLFLLARRFGRALCPLLLARDREEKIVMYDLVLGDAAIAKTAEKVFDRLGEEGVSPSVRVRARLMTEEVLMAVKDRNGRRTVRAEVTLDLNDGVLLTLRDDGEIFDITDADARVRSLRTYLVATVMERQQAKVNLVTTGFNRNVFRFECVSPGDVGRSSCRGSPLT